MIFKLGQILRVLKPMPETTSKRWITEGDIVKVIGIYPHHIMVEKLKPGAHGWHMRQCYCLNGIDKDLEALHV